MNIIFLFGKLHKYIKFIKSASQLLFNNDRTIIVDIKRNISIV